MPSLRTVVAASIVAVASADYSIDPESVPLGVRRTSDCHIQPKLTKNQVTDIL